MLLENYAEYARHARLYTGIHALKQKPKFKTGAISESTTALNEMEQLGLLCKPVNGEDMTSVADTVGDMTTSEGGLEQGRVHTDFSGPTSGSTSCVAIIRNNQVVVANAGDSQCVIKISRKGHVI